jgi:outer membrane protein
MKKLVLLLSITFSLSSFAQIEKPITKGNKIISGAGSIESFHSRSGDFGYNTFNLSISPGVGYFIIDNLAIGLNTNFSITSQGGYGLYTLGLAPYGRYYFKNGFFVNAELGYNLLHGLKENRIKQKEYSIIPGIGYAIFLNPKVSFEPSLNYRHVNGPDSNSRDGVFLELKFNIFL